MPRRVSARLFSLQEMLLAFGFASASEPILISCDPQHITAGNRYQANMRSEVRKRLSRLVPQLPPERIVMMATHTHVAPAVQNETAEPYPGEIHAVRLGEIAMVTNPFELYLDDGIRIKGRSPAVQTFVIQLAGTNLICQVDGPWPMVATGRFHELVLRQHLV